MSKIINCCGGLGFVVIIHSSPLFPPLESPARHPAQPSCSQESSLPAQPGKTVMSKRKDWQFASKDPTWSCCSDLCLSNQQGRRLLCMFKQRCNSLDFSHEQPRLGLPWWLSGKEPFCQCRRLRFNPWSRKIPHAMGATMPCTTPIESVL